jgi:hypothetical protein
MNRGISGDPDPEEKEDGEYYTVTREIHGEREIGGCSESEVPDPGGGVQLAGPRRLGDIGGGRCSLAEIHSPPLLHGSALRPHVYLQRGSHACNRNGVAPLSSEWNAEDKYAMPRGLYWTLSDLIYFVLPVIEYMLSRLFFLLLCILEHKTILLFIK